MNPSRLASGWSLLHVLTRLVLLPHPFVYREISLKSDYRNLKGFVKVYEGGCKAKFQRASDAHADLREQQPPIEGIC